MKIVHFRPISAVFTHCGEPPALDLKCTGRPERVTCWRCRKVLKWREKKQEAKRGA